MAWDALANGLRCTREWPDVFTIRAEFENLPDRVSIFCQLRESVTPSIRVNFVHLRVHSCNYRVWYGCHRVTLLGIVLASVVDLQLTMFGANFARNSKFCIRVAILAQFQDSALNSRCFCCCCLFVCFRGGSRGSQTTHLRRSEKIDRCISRSDFYRKN